MVSGPTVVCNMVDGFDIVWEGVGGHDHVKSSLLSSVSLPPDYNKWDFVTKDILVR